MIVQEPTTRKTEDRCFVVEIERIVKGISKQIIVLHHVDSSVNLKVSSNKQNYKFFWVENQKHVYLYCNMTKLNSIF
jgi:hypothetical protein